MMARYVLWPVVWCPSGEVIGKATSERGALNVCGRRISRTPWERKHERFTTSLKESIAHGWAWHCGPQLRP